MITPKYEKYFSRVWYAILILFLFQMILFVHTWNITLEARAAQGQVQNTNSIVSINANYRRMVDMLMEINMRNDIKNLY